MKVFPLLTESIRVEHISPHPPTQMLVISNNIQRHVTVFGEERNEMKQNVYYCFLKLHIQTGVERL